VRGRDERLLTWGIVHRKLLGILALAVAVLILGNLAILAAFAVGRAVEPGAELAIEGIDNVRRVDDRLFRGEAPTAGGYRALAERQVATVVDLRAERDLDVPRALLGELGIDRVSIPIRDGQTPTRAQVEQFLSVMGRAEGPVFVHCGAGVGRAGSMAAAYLVAQGEASARGALARNLAVGPPSLEQIVYVSSLDSDRLPEQPPKWIETVSRVFDGPRRIWSALRA